MMSRSKINSRAKGAAGECELAHELSRIFGCQARRGRQFSGSPDSPDVITDLDGIHIECKRVERLYLYQALEQSRHDAGEGEIPVVIHRKNREKWVAIVELDRLPELCEIIMRHLQKPGEGFEEGFPSSGESHGAG